MLSWQAILLLALSKTVFSGSGDSNSTLATMIEVARVAFSNVTPFVASLLIKAYVLVYLLHAMGKSDNIVLDCLGSFLVVRTIRHAETRNILWRPKICVELSFGNCNRKSGTMKPYAASLFSLNKGAILFTLLRLIRIISMIPANVS